MYQVEGRTNWNQTWSVLAMNITAKDVDRLTSRKEAQLINSVSPYSTYEFRIAAANTLGYGPFSIPSPQYNTRPDRIFLPPAHVGGGGGKTGDLTITWTPFVGQQQNASGTYYKVFWRRLVGVDPQEVTEESEFQSQIVKHSRSAGLFVATVDRNRRYYYTPYKVKGTNKFGLKFTLTFLLWLNNCVLHNQLQFKVAMTLVVVKNLRMLSFILLKMYLKWLRTRFDSLFYFVSFDSAHLYLLITFIMDRLLRERSIQQR